MAFSTNPLPLGKLTPGAAASIQAISNLAAGVIDPTSLVADLVIQAHPDNPGRMYVCNSAAAPDTVNYTNVLRVLVAGAFYSAASAAHAVNGVDVRNYYVGADDALSFACGEVREG